MTPDDAQKLVNALDAEIARRRAKKDAAQDARWLEEHGDDSVVLLALQLDRLANRLDAPSPAPIPSDDDAVIRSRQLDEIAEMASELAERLERLCDHEEAEAAGVPRCRPVIIGPRVRAPHLLGKEPKPNGENAKSRKLTRTAIAQEKAQAELQARLAHVRPTQSGQEPAGEWMFGTVQKYDSRTMSGIVAIGGGPARLELSFGMSAIMRAGITTLSPGQSLECHLTKGADGILVIAEIKLSAGERAAALADLERQAQAAEENYRVELKRRGLH